MYKIIYYRDRRGNQPVLDYIRELEKHTDKDRRVKAAKIWSYIDVLLRKGKLAGEPFIKHIEGEIWELRPASDRLLFAAWEGATLIILTHFIKTTPKTPRNEIDRAKRTLADFRRRLGK
ncbi:MAG: type II toxin-antitoxin system RelE/ParE family toxin [Synergistaceae bacterium]|nr:type II toxin-antitoxin system RelE/ParE family toxin [Synergistaceae bacterium]